MSAIAGIFNLNDEPINLEHGRSLMKALEKFPANDIQTWHNDKVFLGCHAQWITPESIGEKLPYYDYERQLAITADAIIDNREELFEKLRVDRSRQKEITDSELILLAYEKWGEDSPKFLVGDFAYMIWDDKNQKMFGARDFSGSRTLYYFYGQRKFTFSTVINPFFSLPYIDKKLNEQWLAEFLVIPGVGDSIRPGSTVYRQINQLPPSHSITIMSGNTTIKRYCFLLEEKKLKLKSNEEYEEAFKEVFDRAVTSQIRSHTLVGARLSGGLDSGTVSSFAAKALKKEKKLLHTFSYIPEESFIDWTPKSRMADERPYIKETVNYVGNISEHYLDFEGKSPFTEINDLLEIMEMPYKFFENSFWLKGIYEEANKLGIGVLLNGGRGNYTISWGPSLDYFAVLLKKLKWVQLNREMLLYCKNRGSGRKYLLSIIGKRAFPIVGSFITQEKDQYEYPQLINPDFARWTDVSTKDLGINNLAKMNIYKFKKQHFEQVNSWNLNGTSRTKFTLGYSLWDRDPTNDLRVVKFCLSVPEEQFVQKGYDRALIRRSTKSYLPDRVRFNQKVRGIQGADIVHRMKSNWRQFIAELLELCNDSEIKQFLNVNVIKNSIEALRGEPTPEIAFNADFKVLMRSLIVYRFFKKFT